MAIRTGACYTTREAAQMLGVARITLQSWIKRGRVKVVAHTLGGHHRFTIEEINQIRREMGLAPLENVLERDS